MNRDSLFNDGARIGYTLATGRLLCPIADFHAFAETLLDRPILTHEFADQRTWAELRQVFEAQTKAALSA
jgi:hypothetical protein